MARRGHGVLWLLVWHVAAVTLELLVHCGGSTTIVPCGRSLVAGNSGVLLKGLAHLLKANSFMQSEFFNSNFAQRNVQKML